MAGTCTVVEETYGSMKKVKWTWTTDSASAQAAAASRTTSGVYNGVTQRLITIPDGSNAPSASYSVAVLDQDSTDILIGGGGSRAAAATEQVVAASLGVIANDTMTLSCTSAGASAAGVVYLYIR